MDIFINIINRILDFFKKILVRFKNAKFGLLFITNIFKLPEFLFDVRGSVFSKLKVIGSFVFTLVYFGSPIDLMPESIFGGFGFIDDLIILIWFLGIMSEEVQKYKKSIGEAKDPNVIDDVNFKVKDDD
ncbi:YkvA family protein [Metaclostridioides mangenotii]|uniref:YkvA family protein n=1 Tax=Metaclostridioides mangenotii TaxID=1540 RepID=UPI000467D0B2|nr:YkvA family protein [Clostridioides mangenotii]